MTAGARSRGQMLIDPPSPESREMTTEILHVPGRATALLLEIISQKLDGAVLWTAQIHISIWQNKRFRKVYSSRAILSRRETFPTWAQLKKILG
jgi:hypothetical protein